MSYLFLIQILNTITFYFIFYLFKMWQLFAKNTTYDPL